MADVNPDYTKLTNKPQINGVLLVGDLTPRQLGFPEIQIATDEEIDEALGWSNNTKEIGA